MPKSAPSPRLASKRSRRLRRERQVHPHVGQHLQLVVGLGVHEAQARVDEWRQGDLGRPDVAAHAEPHLRAQGLHVAQRGLPARGEGDARPADARKPQRVAVVDPQQHVGAVARRLRHAQAQPHVRGPRRHPQDPLDPQAAAHRVVAQVHAQVAAAHRRLVRRGEHLRLHARSRAQRQHGGQRNVRLSPHPLPVCPGPCRSPAPAG
jgi:hypothetical protein